VGRQGDLEMSELKHVVSKTERDKQVVEAVVRRYGPLSRIDIHKLTHLQPSAISRLTRRLLSEGWLIESGRAENPTGRKPVLLRFNDEHAFLVGVGFNTENVVAAVMNLHPEIRASVTEPTCLHKGTEGLVYQLLGCVQKVMLEARADPGSVLGIGVAGSGLVNTRTGTLIMSSTLDFLKNVPLQQIFEKEFGVSTLIENITRAKTVAESVLGAGEGRDDVIYIEYGAGIGAGIMIGGRVLYGSGYAAGEFGHTHVMDEGPACKCGSFGCLEALVGCAALEAKIRKVVAEGGYSQASKLANGDVNKISGWMVLEAAARLRDKTCLAIVEQVGKYLGLGLANLVNLFNPSIVVLDQRLNLAGDGLLDQVVKVVRRQALSHATDDLLIRFGKLGSCSAVLGMGLMLLERRFQIPSLKPPRFMIEPQAVPVRLGQAPTKAGAASKPNNGRPQSGSPDSELTLAVGVGHE